MMLQYETIFTRWRTLTITLNRPDKLNAGATHVMLDLIDAFDRANADNEG